MVGRWILVVLFCGFIGAVSSWMVNTLFGLFAPTSASHQQDLGGLALSMTGDLGVRAVNYSAIQNGILLGVLAGCVIVIADAMVKSRLGVQQK
ncbi:MAG: hypothetical protein WCK51_07715 [Armatimonadota bacterium]